MIEVACGVIVKKPTFLIARRPRHKERGGMWEFPGGKLEPGESPEDCLKREIKEEFDVLIRCTFSLPAIEHQYADIAIRLFPILAEIESGILTPMEHQSYQWITLNEAHRFAFSAADLKVLHELSLGWKNQGE